MSRKPDRAMAAAAAFGAARFYLLSGRPSFVDEQAGLLTGWLLSKGGVLYADVFTHHLPFEYLIAQAAAWAGGPGLGTARAGAFVVWLAACLALHLLLRARGSLAWTAPCFAVLSACWAPLWWGNFLLVELYWSLALAVLAALWERPFASSEGGEGAVLSPSKAALAGFLGLLAGTASLPAAAPTAAVLAGTAACGRLRGRWRFFLLGAGGFAVLMAVWGAGRVAWTGLFEQGVRFNLEQYSRFSGFSSGADLYVRQLFDALLHWTGLGPRSWRGIEPLLTLTVLGGAAAAHAARGIRWSSAVLAVFVLARVTAEAPGLEGAPPFHASAYYVLCVLTLSAGLSRLVEFRLKAGLAAALLLAACTWPAWRDRGAPSSPREAPAVAALAREVTSPEDRVLALPSYPLFYLESRRAPGFSYILYLPWVAAAYEKRALRELREDPPALIFMERGAVGGRRWYDYGRPLIEEIGKGYTPFRLDRAYGGRIGGIAEDLVWEDGVYIRHGLEGKVLLRAKHRKRLVSDIN